MTDWGSSRGLACMALDLCGALSLYPACTIFAVVIPEFFDDITQYASLSVVGMAKNVGKTVCLRALLQHYRRQDRASQLAVTSIGVDGESTDALFKNAKPELDFYPGMIVQTSEQHYLRRRLSAEILDISRETTACGRLVTAKVLTPGKLMLSGYAYTQGLKRYISLAHQEGAATAIIDGALSRMSLASPFVSEAMVLCTGAALSKNMNELVSKTCRGLRYHARRRNTGLGDSLLASIGRASGQVQALLCPWFVLVCFWHVERFFLEVPFCPGCPAGFDCQ